MIIWDKEKTDRIFEMRQQGITYQEIAQEFGTNSANISTVIARMKTQGYDIIKANRWTSEEELELIRLREEGKNNKEIGEALGKSHDSVKKKASELIKANALSMLRVKTSKGGVPWDSESIDRLMSLRAAGLRNEEIAESLNFSLGRVKYKIRELIYGGKISPITKRTPDPSMEELLEDVRKYISWEACPPPIANKIKKVFGSWTKALEAAGISGNIGGKFDPNRTTRVYLLDFGDFYKIGVTQQQIKSRFSGAPAHTILDYIETDLDNAVYLEKELKKAVKQYVAEHPWFERNGKTECFKTNQPIRYLEDIFAPSADQ